MDTLEAIRQRRSVKQFDPDHAMSEDEIRQLMELAILSPTSFNIQNWRFVLVRDKVLRRKLCEASWGQNQVNDASLAILICADLHSWDREPQRYWQNAPEPVQDALVPMIKRFYEDNRQLQRDEAMRSAGIAGQTIMLAAKAMGYDSCPMVGYDPEKVAELIDLPKDHVLGMMVVVGKALSPARQRGGQVPLDEVVFTDRFA